jgi:hypothetical protein
MITCYLIDCLLIICIVYGFFFLKGVWRKNHNSAFQSSSAFSASSSAAVAAAAAASFAAGTTFASRAFFRYVFMWSITLFIWMLKI